MFIETQTLTEPPGFDRERRRKNGGAWECGFFCEVRMGRGCHAKDLVPTPECAAIFERAANDARKANAAAGPQEEHG
jgi:hypothetical protein